MSDDLAGNGLDPAWCKAMENLGAAALGGDQDEVDRLVKIEAAARKAASDAQS